MSKFIPDLGINPITKLPWSGADLTRLSWDIPYREQLYRLADPDNALEDSISDCARSLIQHGRKIANARSVKVHELALTAIDYNDVHKLIVDKKISASSACELFEKGEGQHNWEEKAKELGLLMGGSDEEVLTTIREIFIAKSKIVMDYLGGKEAAIGAIMGMVLKKKKFDPVIVRQRIAEVAKEFK